MLRYVQILILVSACTSDSHGPKAVSPSEYIKDRDCWIDSDKGFSSFLILENYMDGTSSLNPVSYRCYINEFQSDTTLNYINSIKLFDNKREFSRKTGKAYNIITNSQLSDRLESKTIDSREFFVFSGILTSSNIPGYENNTVYDIQKIKRLEHLDIKFDQFSKLNSKEKMELFKKI